MKKLLKPCTILLLLGLCVAVYSKALYLKKFTFDEEKALKKWKKMVLNGEVEYKLIKAGEKGYIHALSESSCSALYYTVVFRLKSYPILKWKWRILRFPDISKARTDEERDDYAARVYVIFPFLNFSSSRFLEYIWAENIPTETVIDSPFSDNVKLIVVRSGREPEGEWASETRNVYEDYARAFGEKSRLHPGAIAIMCDADSTKTSAESLFDDIVIESESP